MAYLDNAILGRRVDFNYNLLMSIGGNPATGFQAETSTTNITRASLQAMLWAGRKIN